MPTFQPEEISKLQNYLQTKFGDGFALKLREKAPDSLEVLYKGEFIAVLYKDVDEGETSYSFNMTILDIDLESDKTSIRA